ncbi:MAG: hypothetical protein ABI950_00805 [Solirubrobacteraceae bacterium]
MARVPARRRPPVDVGVLLELTTLVQRHWGRLTPGERAHVTALLRKSKGNPGALTKAERADVRRLVGKLDVPAFGRDVRPLAQRLRTPRGR